MHILLIHQSFVALDEPGGTRHHELARYLAERGHRVTVIASPVSYLTGASAASIPGGKGSQTPGPGSDGRITILRSYTYAAVHRSFVHRVLSFFSFMASSFVTGLRVQNVDLVWGTSPPIFQGVTAWALSRIKGVPFLFEVRDLWPAFAIQVGVLRQPLLIHLSQWLERFLYRGADRVVVNSPGFESHVRTHGARRVELVPNGADPAMFDPSLDGRDFRQTHELGERFVVLYAGAHGMSNDLGVVLEAARLICERNDIVIVFLGDGKEKSALVQRATELQLANVRFLAPVPKNEMKEALAAADACLAILKAIPLYATVYPNKVFDYLAAGRPVILAIDGVIREVVESAQAGVFTPPGDAASLAKSILQLADHRQEAVQMGENGRRYIEEHFDRSALAEKLAGILEDIHHQD